MDTLLRNELLSKRKEILNINENTDEYIQLEGIQNTSNEQTLIQETSITTQEEPVLTFTQYNKLLHVSKHNLEEIISKLDNVNKKNRFYCSLTFLGLISLFALNDYILVYYLL